MNHPVELVRTVVLACSQAWAASQAQPHDQRPESARLSARLRMFLEAPVGFRDQIRTELDFVEFVHDRREADVHVLVTRSRARNSRCEYTLTFTGFGLFEGIQTRAQVGVDEQGMTPTAEVRTGTTDTTARKAHSTSRERAVIA